MLIFNILGLFHNFCLLMLEKFREKILNNPQTHNIYTINNQHIALTLPHYDGKNTPIVIKINST